MLKEIQEKYDLANESMTKIEEASEKQTEAIDQIKYGLSQISSVVQSNAATSEENSATSEAMSVQASMLREEIGRFIIRRKNEPKVAITPAMQKNSFGQIQRSETAGNHPLESEQSVPNPSVKYEPLRRDVAGGDKY